MTHEHDTHEAQPNTETAKGKGVTHAPTPLCTRCAPVKTRLSIGDLPEHPQHPGDCRTALGRLLARPCRDCGQRFRFPKRTRGHYVRCPDCRAKRAAARDSRPARAAALRAKRSAPAATSYAEHRSACEIAAAADPIGAQLQRTASYALLLYAVQRMEFCPDCERMLDVDSAVLIDWQGKQGICCASCYDTKHAALIAQRPGIAVHDGRALGDPITKRSVS